MAPMWSLVADGMSPKRATRPVPTTATACAGEAAAAALHAARFGFESTDIRCVGVRRRMQGWQASLRRVHLDERGVIASFRGPGRI